MTQHQATRRAAAAFTLTELLVGLALFMAAIAIVQTLLFGGGRAYGRARARLDLIAACRTAMEQVEADVRRASSRIRVSDDGAELLLSVPVFGAAGLPARSPAGNFEETEVRYRYDATARTLIRNGETVGREIPDLLFSQALLDSAGSPIPMVTVEAAALIDGRPVRLAATAVPRFAAGWAANPAWSLTTLGAPYRYQADR